MTLEDDADRIIQAQDEAADTIRFAIMRFLTVTTEENAALSLMGLEFALLSEAARCSLLLNEKCGAQGTKAMFGQHACEQYEYLKEYRGDLSPNPKPPKLKVVE